MIAPEMPSEPGTTSTSRIDIVPVQEAFSLFTRRSPTTDRPLVVRGAVPAKRLRFPIPLSIRACGFPAHGLPMIFCAWLRSLRVADGAAKSVQAVPVKPLFGPLTGLPGTQVPAPLLDHQAEEPPHHIPVDLTEFDPGVAGAKVVAPPRKTGFRSAITSRISTPTRLRPVCSRTLARTRARAV